MTKERFMELYNNKHFTLKRAHAYADEMYSKPTEEALDTLHNHVKKLYPGKPKEWREEYLLYGEYYEMNSLDEHNYINCDEATTIEEAGWATQSIPIGDTGRFIIENH